MGGMAAEGCWGLGTDLCRYCLFIRIIEKPSRRPQLGLRTQKESMPRSVGMNEPAVS